MPLSEVGKHGIFISESYVPVSVVFLIVTTCCFESEMGVLQIAFET